MYSINSEWAIEKLETFIQISKPKNPSANGFLTSSSVPTAHREEVLSAWVIIEKILEQVYPEWRNRHAGSASFEFKVHRDAAITALGLLKSQAEIDSNLALSVTRVESTNFHAWVWEAAEKLWHDGHFRSAIQASSIAIDLKLQKIASRSDVSGVELVRQVFSLENPVEGKIRLRVPKQANDATTKSLQLGVKALGEACFLAVRNPITHEQSEFSESEAIEVLATLSYFCRLIESCDSISE